MIDKPNRNMTLKVCLEDVGTHNKAVLDFFFAKLGQHTFSRVDTQDEANVLIIDYDYPPARERYEDTYSQWQKPAIVLSISTVELENAIWLAKPLTSRALLDAAEQVQAKLADQPAVESITPVSEALATTAETEPENDEQRQLAEQLRQKQEAAKQTAALKRPEIKPVEDAPVNIPLVSTPAVEELSDGDAASETDTPASSARQEASSDAVSPQNQPVPFVEPVLSEAEQAARWEQLCGTGEDIDPASDVSQIQAEDSFYLSSLKDAVRLARQCQQGVLLTFAETRIYVLPEIHRVFCAIPIDSAGFESFIQGCNAQDGGKMHILSTQEIHELNDMIAQQTSALYDLESFVWTSSLLSSKGVLSRALDPAQAVGLRHWPSLTRLERFPNVMPIAALWSTDSYSAFDIAKSLNVPQRYVFSFYNAASALGLIEQDSEKLIKKQPSSRTTEAPRGLFSRLLKRLIGG